MECCSDPYTRKFDESNARKELSDYRSGKIKKNSRPLINALSRLQLKDKSLLDIGGGVGIVSFELLKKGVSKVTHIEYSHGYKEVFHSECIRQQVAEKVVSVQGDYTALHHQVGVADLVCLDKVICCYGNYKELVTKSCLHASRWYAYVIPRDIWWVKWGAALADIFRRLVNDTFKTYVHPQADIESMVLGFGFIKLTEQTNREWVTVVYERSQN